LPDNATTATTSYQGDGSSGVYIWGAQLEQLPYATSYIPTQGSTSTRIKETCNNSGSAQDFNSEEGVLYAEISALANDGTFRSLAISDGTTSNTVVIFLLSTSNTIYSRVTSNGTNVYDNLHVALNTTDFNKIAFSYSQNLFKVFINGVKVSEGTSGNHPNNLSKLALDDGGGGADFYGNVKELKVFTKALSDEELQKLTTI